jgi:hypothetical protein
MWQSNPEMGHFFKNWIPGTELPDRCHLSGKILMECVTHVEGETKTKVQGKLMTGQCDGWKNISKPPLIAMMMTVEYQVCLKSYILSCD